MQWTPEAYNLWGRCGNPASDRFDHEVWAGDTCPHRIPWRPRYGCGRGPRPEREEEQEDT
jgi:hypothetical protein